MLIVANTSGGDHPVPFPINNLIGSPSESVPSTSVQFAICTYSIPASAGVGPEIVCYRSVLPMQFSSPEINSEQFTLDNGLTVIVHEDHKTPIVAVNSWYHVGSKNEKEGKTGFAHLFEHLMFGGSEHVPGSYIEAMERIGATDLNGTTSEDRTNYFENVPASALEYALFAESDRMGHFYNTISQELLDLQRGVVQNEKRQGDNQPYAIVEDLVVRATYPGRPPLRTHGDRVHGGSRFGFAGRCSRMVSNLLHALERGACAGGRHHSKRSRETRAPATTATSRPEFRSRTNVPGSPR